MKYNDKITLYSFFNPYSVFIDLKVLPPVIPVDVVSVELCGEMCLILHEAVRACSDT